MARSLDEWTASIFIIAVAVLVVSVLGWEFFWRHGQDPFVLSAAIFLTIIPLAGRAAVRIIRAVRE